MNASRVGVVEFPLDSLTKMELINRVKAAEAELARILTPVPPAPPPPRRSNTHMERWYYFMDMGLTLFLRETEPMSGTWEGAVALCNFDCGDRFDRKIGRTVSRRKYFNRLQQNGERMCSFAEGEDVTTEDLKNYNRVEQLALEWAEEQYGEDVANRIRDDAEEDDDESTSADPEEE